MKWIQADDLLPHVLRRRADEDPDFVYLRHVDGSSVTYRQSHEAAMAWAGALREHGVTAGANVLTMLPNGFDTYHAWLGIAWLGAVEVSLNTGYQGRLLKYTINTSRAKLLVIHERFLPALADIAAELEHLETVVVIDRQHEGSRPARGVLNRAEFFHSTTPLDPRDTAGPQPWDVSCIIWTSGTTGPSKGVMLPWAEMHTFCAVVNDVTGPSDVLYHFMPSFHIGGKLIVNAGVVQGSRIALREQFSRTNFWRDVREHAATHTNIQGPMVRMLMTEEPRADDADNPLRTMGCAPLIPELDDFCARFGITGVNTYYGMTEIGLPFVSPGLSLANHESCGQLRDGYQVRIVDEHDYPLSTGQVGELIVRTDHPWTMNAGYYGMPTETAHAWRNGWFHTGDAAYVDSDGNYYFVDRLKDAIRRRGENISSFEVEVQVTEHPEVVDCAAIAASSRFGEDDVMIIVVRAEHSRLTKPALLDWLRERMPRFMLPRYVEFVDELPRTDATLRVKKAELRARGVTERTWDSEHQSARSGYTP